MPGLIAHEWIAAHGGSENVLQVLADHYSEAEIFALWQEGPSRFQGSRVRVSSLATKKRLQQRKHLALPLMPMVWKTARIEGYDWLLISSHAFAHQLASNARAPQRTHVYVHTPARYIWAPELDARRESPLLHVPRHLLRRLDRYLVSEDAAFAVNSVFVAKRTRRAWGIDARVIYPPVDVEQLWSVKDWRDVLSGPDQDLFDSLPDLYVLGASRFVDYKRLDQVIEVAEQLQVPAVLAGRGPNVMALKARAALSSVPVRIVEAPSNSLLRALMQHASLYIFPPVEDFGIMPVEAAALGTPCLVNVVGGAAESVALLGAGGMTDFNDASSRRAAAANWLGWQDDQLAARATRFGNRRFLEEIEQWRQ